MTELHGSLKRSEVDGMNRLRVEALRQRDEALAHVVKIERALADAVFSMEAAVKILHDRGLDHSERTYEARAYLNNRVAEAREFMDKQLIEPAVARCVCPVTHKECSAGEPCLAPACELAVL